MGKAKSENKFIEIIEQYKNANLTTYKDPSRIYADFSDEIETTNEYNGRQIFELLQNAEDANSNEIEFDLDINKRILRVSNNGNAFSTEGIHSLMIAHLSSKNKVQFIGNKGLGFRSILNWAESVSIYANDSCITFSEEIAKNNLELIGDEQKAKIREYKQKDHYHDDVITFPVLGIPEIAEHKNNPNWITQIEIKYRKEFEKDIIDQLSSINEEVLLFLNSITKITYIKNGVIENKVEITDNEKQSEFVRRISIGDKTWTVFSEQDELPDEYQDKKLRVKEHYEIRVAISKDFDVPSNLLYCYFPTQISIALPCIIHGTFDIDSSRKTINESSKNEYIFSKIPLFLGKIIEELKKNNNEKPNWNFVKLLKPKTNSSDYKYINSLYENLNNLISFSEIFPTVDSERKYKKRDEITYYSEELSNKVHIAYNDMFPEMLIPLGNDYEDLYSLVYGKEYDSSDFWNRMEKICKERNLSLTERVEIIKILTKIRFVNNNKVSLLINTKNEIIDSSIVCFTIPSSENISIPSFIRNNIDIINTELYEKLSESFDINEQDVKNKSRALVGKLRNIVNIQSYDFSEITDRILTEEKRIIDSQEISNENKQKVVKETVSCLFNNFINSNSKVDQLKKVPYLLAKDDTIQIATNLFFSSTYPSGKITEALYGEVLTQNEYLIDKDSWNLKCESEDLIEKYFCWLGVNRFIKSEEISITFSPYSIQHYDFLLKYKEQGDFDSIAYTYGELKTLKITDYNLDKLKQLPPQKIICLLKNEKRISERILVNTDETISFHYHLALVTKTINCSYIMYQLQKTNIFSSIMLEDLSDELKKVIGTENFIDYDWLLKNNISKEDTNAILIKLGAQKSFDTVSQEKLYELINKQYELNKDNPSQTSQKIYQLIADALDKKYEAGEHLNINKDLLYCCKQYGKYHFEKAADCYYSDNAVLPKKMMTKLPIFNIGTRKGEQKIERCFGIKNLKSENVKINITMDEEQKCSYEEKTLELQKRFISRKAYILAFRLDKVNKEETVQAKALSEFTYELIGKGNYSFGSDKPNEFEDYDFILDGNKAIIRVPDISLDALIKESLFLDAFAECLCILFKITDSNELKNIFRNTIKEDISDLKHIIECDMQEGTLEHCVSLLKIKYLTVLTFWNKIFEKLNKKIPSNVDSWEELNNYITSQLQFDLGLLSSEIDYDNFENSESILLISKIEEQLAISPKELLPTKGFYNYHKQQVQNIIYDYTNTMKKQLYLYLTDNIEEQKDFISICNKFESLDTYEQEINENIYVCYPNYLEILQSKIDSKYNINLENGKNEFGIQKIENLYKELFVDYDENNLPNSIRSLVYFPNHKEEILEYINRDKDNKKADNNDVQNNDKEIVEANLDGTGEKPFIPTGKPGNPRSANDNGDKGKKRIGRKAEKDVFDSFVEKFGEENVLHISGNADDPFKTDSAHCDFVYKIPGTSQWRCLEVKHVSNGTIVLTAAEKEFGCKEENKKRYDFALVDEERIHLVKNVFDFPDDDTFEKNKRFKISTKDYYLKFKIQDNGDHIK